MIGRIQKLKNKKGFTLVELIVVIAIIAVLTAVIVPLIARYSAQAQYTTLQDAAQTISNSANNAMSDANQKGVVSATEISGTKSSGAFTVTVGTETCSADPAGTYSTNANARAAEKLWESLNTTLPSDCAFYIKVYASAVSGVIYTTDTGVTPADGLTIDEVTGFDNAYEVGGIAVGVSGSYIP